MLDGLIFSRSRMVMRSRSFLGVMSDKYAGWNSLSRIAIEALSRRWVEARWGGAWP